MPEIDSFCAASGMGINKNKTQIITSLALNAPKPFHPAPRIMPIIDLTVPPPTSKTPVPLKRKRKRGPRLTRSKSSSVGEYVVAAIISKRWNPYQHPIKAKNQDGSTFGFWEYEVLWEGYDTNHCTWEPIENLSNCLKAVDDYNRLWVPPPTYLQILDLRMDLCPWKDIKFVDSTKYLGIIFSNNKDAYLTREANFLPVLAAARDRLYSYQTVLKRSSLMLRILIINVYITSLFSYKIDFMTVPDTIYESYRSLISKSIIPYGGTAFIYEHLTVPTKLMGLRTHINDLWVQTMMRHLRRSNLKEIKDPSDLPWPLNTNDDTNGIYFHSPIFEDNTKMALMEFLGKDIFNWDGSADLSALTDKNIKLTLIQCGLHTGPSTPNFKTNRRTSKLNEIFKGYNTTPCHTLEHFATLDSKTPNQLLLHHLKLYTYALETDQRIRFFNPLASIHPSNTVLQPYPCYLCSNGNDATTHIYHPQSCSTVKDLISDLAITHDTHHQALIDSSFVSELINANAPLFVMEFSKSNSKSLDKASFVLALNYAIWQLRCLVRKGGVPGSFHKYALRQNILKFKPFWSNPKGKKPSGTKYGSASSRSEAQKTLALKDSLNFVNSIPPNATCIYTDGSSLSNPGPAGSGALVVGPTGPGPPTYTRLFCSLCTNDEGRSNNFAEIWAIGMAISYLIVSSSTRHQVFILSDSNFIIKLLNRTAFSTEFEHLIVRILSLRSIYSTNFPIQFCWVPGHVGLLGNEAADKLANIGSGSLRTHPLRIPTSHDTYFEYTLSNDISPP